MCNLRVIMNNLWVGRALLSDASKLRTTEATEFRSQTFDFSKTYISTDMTKVEQDINRKLVLELKRNIRALAMIRPQDGLLSLGKFRLVPDFNILFYLENFFRS